MERRRRQRRSDSVTRGARLQSWLLDVFALYGFNPWRTVVWMTMFVVLFAGVWWWAAQGCERDSCKDESVYAMSLKGQLWPGRQERRGEISGVLTARLFARRVPPVRQSWLQ